MTYKLTKWMILIVPTLVVGLWEYVRHQFLMPYVSMEMGNVLTPVILFAVSITLLHRWFSYLERMQEELQRERALKAKLEQREQLARELHDGIAQSLFLLSVKVDRADRQQTSQGGAYDWHGLRKTIHEVNRYVREAISDLRIPPDAKESEANDAAIPALIRQMAAEQQLALQLDWRLGEEAWSAKAKLELLSCVREALINAGKHAGVQEVRIAGSGDARRFLVKVDDSGTGFAADHPPEPGRYGLQIMRERAEHMGWELTIVSVPGNTTVEIRGGGGEE
ncbi:sensor histidine kinase [Paenibacillus macerans]|uniref:sensor histidine kinase n=1 Tax=Paenibacillus macerans TaxID=44252 RepID=UPI003D3102E2